MDDSQKAATPFQKDVPADQPTKDQVEAIREAVGMTRLEGILRRACSEGIQVLNEI